MKRKIITILIASMFTSVIQMKAQSGQVVGANSTMGDLYQDKDDFGVGSANNPEARIHIFNGVSLEAISHNYTGYRPLLISGEKAEIVLIQPPSGPPYSNPNPTLTYSFPIRENYFTVDQQGYVGAGLLNPFTKMNLHNGIFTISEGLVEEPTRWEVHGTKNAFAVKDYNANRFRFWINKSDGYVGIGTELPDEKLHVKDGVLKVENNGGTTTYGSLKANFSHFVTSLPNFYFNKSIYIAGAVSSYQTDLLLQANGATGIKVKTNGQVNIGNTSVTTGTHSNYKLSVDGLIVSKKVVVTMDNWADNVFDEKYKLRSLAEIEKFVKQQKHLPEIPSEAEVMENGVELGEINMLLLKKVEELTLYMIDMQKQIDDLKTAK